MENEILTEVRRYWDKNPCGARASSDKDRRAYFDEIEKKRYEKEPHIPEIARFGAYRGLNVLEIGCGIGTDGINFARQGAIYTGLDLAEQGIRLTKERFSLYGLNANLFCSNAEDLPFKNDCFDHVYSFGVVHHTPNTEKSIREMLRVLKPGGTICVMVYNRTSINHYVEIMFFRKIARFVLHPKRMPGVLSGILGIDRDILEKHREMYINKQIASGDRWLSANTDGPMNPLSKVYDKAAVMKLFEGFADLKTEVRFFDKSHWPILKHVLPKSIGTYLGNRWGWHRIVTGKKPKSV